MSWIFTRDGILEGVFFGIMGAISLHFTNIFFKFVFFNEERWKEFLDFKKGVKIF